MVQAEQMEATERQVHMGTQTDGPVKPAHAPRCSHPSLAVGRKHGSVCLLPNEKVGQIVSNLWFSRRIETTWTFMSLPDFAYTYFHLLLKQTSVSKAAALIAAVPDHQLESDKVAISSQQSGAIICRCWHFSVSKKKEFSFTVVLVAGCFFFFFCSLLLSAWFLIVPLLHLSKQNHSGLLATAACVGCIWNRKCSSLMLSGVVGGSFNCRRRIYSQPTEWKIGRLMRFSWKKRIPGRCFHYFQVSGVILGADTFKCII